MSWRRDCLDNDAEEDDEEVDEKEKKREKIVEF